MPCSTLPRRPLRPNSLLTSPILPTLLKLAIPNTVAMFGAALVAVAETSYIGRLGTVPLAAIALVFPFTMLTQMMSAGAMGGGVSSAISRALGAGNRDRAAILALHAAMIGVCGGIFFTAMMLLFGRQFFSALGGRGGVLEEASSYSNVLFSGAIAIWLVNTLASVVRGTGDMQDSVGHADRRSPPARFWWAARSASACSVRLNSECPAWQRASSSPTRSAPPS